MNSLTPQSFQLEMTTRMQQRHFNLTFPLFVVTLTTTTVIAPHNQAKKFKVTRIHRIHVLALGISYRFHCLIQMCFILQSDGKTIINLFNASAILVVIVLLWLKRATHSLDSCDTQFIWGRRERRASWKRISRVFSRQCR